MEVSWNCTTERVWETCLGTHGVVGQYARRHLCCDLQLTCVMSLRVDYLAAPVQF